MAEGDTIDSLVEDANELISRGFRPLGPVVFCTIKETGEQPMYWYVQAFFLEAGAFIPPKE